MSELQVTNRAKIFIRAKAAVLALPLLLLSLPAEAQQLENEVSVQRFDPAPGPGNLLVTRSASAIQGHLAWTAGLFVNYAYQPFLVINPDRQEIPVVENMVTGDVLGSLSIVDRLQVGLKVPVSWVKGQGITAAGQPQEGGLEAVGLGDVQLELKGRFFGEPGEAIALGAFVYGTAPTGTITAEGSYIGSSSPTAGGGLIADGRMGPLSYGVNVGGAWRETARIGDSEIGPELRVSGGLGYEISPILGLVADAYGANSFGGGSGSGAIEIDGGVKILPLGNRLNFVLGGGAGVLRGVGLPTARAFLGVSYSATTRDRDGDRIEDSKDACPDAPEDRDGYEDSDGCPDLDNDQDGIPDELDKCPNQAEDMDGYQDADGCPDPDNDGDGIPDASDRCPNEPETMNGFEDADGCPDEKDTDGDGIPDSRDKCINEPEDTDGFQDEDGCPDPDNDGDGIPDNEDECIDLPEDGKGKGKEKTDGCPIDA